MSAKVIRHPRTGQVIDVEAEPTGRGPGYADRFAGARRSQQPPRRQARVQYDEYGDEIEDDYYEDEDDYYEEEAPPRRVRGRGRRRGKVRMGHSPQADAIRNGKANRRRPRTPGRGKGRGRGRGRGYAGETVICEAPKEKTQWGKLLLTGAVFAVAGYAVKAGLDRVTGNGKAKDEGDNSGQAPQPQAIPQQPQQQVNPVHQLLLTSPGANRLMPAYAGGTIQAPQPPPVAAVAPALPAPKKNPKPSDDEDFEDEMLSYMDRYVQDFDEEPEDEDDDF